MKRLIVCCDGTWNHPEQEQNGVPTPTNVYKIFNAISHQNNDWPQNDILQLAYYHPGVGGEGSVSGEGGFLAPLLGGALGIGIRRHICSAYHWLMQHYDSGDEIFIFGFSRGAYTARALAGFIGLGLLDRNDIKTEAEGWERVHFCFDTGYSKTGENKEPLCQSVKKNWQFVDKGQAVPVHFLGVWDTVGAFGIPDDFALLNLLDDPKRWEFYDTKLGNHVKTARHAMAMDEKRASFTVTHWTEVPQNRDVKEVWFSGVHSDVGGGYLFTGLSDCALLWMITEAGSTGLKFRPHVCATIKPEASAPMHNSYTGLFAKLKSRPRNVPAVTEDNAHQFHTSVFERQRISPPSYRAYWKTSKLAPGEVVTIEIFANQHWNKTDIFLEAGAHYCFSAQGQWRDKTDVCGWAGTEDHQITFGDKLRKTATLVSHFSRAFKRIFNNQQADFGLDKRELEMPWFVMVGAIANDGVTTQTAVKQDGSPTPHQCINLTLHRNTADALQVAKSGYLYCYPNDAWAFYDNNSGSIMLSVKRIA